MAERIPAKTSHGDARGYSWPPFAKGHTLSLVHGAWSPRTIAPVAEGLVAELTEAAPWCARPVFAAEVQAWAWAEAEVVLLRRHMDTVGPLTEEGEPAGFLSELHRAETRAAKRRADLGLTPRAWAHLLKAMADTGGDEDALEQLKATGREIIEAAEGGA